MSLCLPQPRITEVFGLEAILSYDHSNTSLTFGLVVVGFILLFQATVLALYPLSLYRGIYALYGTGLPPEREAKSINSRAHAGVQMRWVIVGYTAITGIFAWLRAGFDTGKPLLVGAALHNLAEFEILVPLYLAYKHVNQGQRIGVILMSALITIVIVSPSFKAAVFIEQQFGVIFDYLLLITFLTLYYHNSTDPNVYGRGQSNKEPIDTIHNPNLSNLWSFGLIGAATHFGQIWPLIAGALGIGSGNWFQLVIEGILYFSAPITFLYYARFALEWDRLVDSNAMKTIPNFSAGRNLIGGDIDDKELEAGAGDIRVLGHGPGSKDQEESKVNLGMQKGRAMVAASEDTPLMETRTEIFAVGINSPLRSTNWEFHRIWKRLLLALVLGLATIFGPGLLPRCTTDPLLGPQATPSYGTDPKAPLRAGQSSAGFSNVEMTAQLPLVGTMVGDAENEAGAGVAGLSRAAAGTATAITPVLPAGYCAESDGSLVGFTLLAARNSLELPALIDALSPLVTLSRSHPGNLYYYLLQHTDDVHAAFVEKWASKEDLVAHVHSKDVRSIFDDPYVTSLIANEVLSGPYQTIEPCTVAVKDLPKLHVAFSFQLQTSIDYAYNSISDEYDCSWVQGCLKATVIDPTHRDLTLNPNLIFHVSIPRNEINADHTNAAYVYHVDSYSGSAASQVKFEDYLATITLAKNKTGTEANPLVDVSYVSEFRPVATDPQGRQAVLAFVKLDFINNRIPFLKQKFDGKQ